MKVAVTGAAGRLGSTLVRLLVEQGHEVVATDIRYRTDLPVPMRVLDLAERQAAYDILPGCDVVAHLAYSGHQSDPDRQRVIANSTSLYFNVFQAAVETGVKQVIFASTVQVMAGSGVEDFWPVQKQLDYLPLDANLPARPSNCYSMAKWLGEQLLEFTVLRSGLASGVAIRFPFMWTAERAAEVRERGVRWGREMQSPPWHLSEGCSHLTYRDASRLMIACMKASLPGYRVYFPSASDWTAASPLPEVVARHYAGIPLRKPVEQMKNLVDISRITQETGWEPQDKLYETPKT